METAKVVTPHHEEKNLFEDGRFSRSDLLEQLERIVRSKHFRNSKRYPTFLRFVFDRASHYDTNEDPIVRVTAGEIRKRIAQYYQEPGHEEELRIDLPLGSYVPHFLPAHALPVAELDHHRDPSDASTATTPALEDEMVSPHATGVAPTQSIAVAGIGQWKTIFLSALLLLLVATATLSGILLRNYWRDRGINYFWRPIIAAGSPA